MDIIDLVLIVPAVAILMRLKGRGTKDLGVPIDGSYSSAVLFGLLCAGFYQSYLPILGGLGWFIGNAPSMGELAGGVGGHGGNWERGANDKIITYRSNKNLATSSWKLFAQRGIFTGAMLAVTLWDPAFIIAGALMPVCYWVGVSVEQWRTQKIDASWWLGEVLFGAVIGAAFFM